VYENCGRGATTTAKVVSARIAIFQRLQDRDNLSFVDRPAAVEVVALNHSRPLLLNFVREQRAVAIKYRYDRPRRLNLVDDGEIPVLLVAGGMALMKTQGAVEDPT
jgi:hypothetical protein